MKLTSVRLRLTLWNIGVVALALLMLILAMSDSVETRVVASVDQDLRHEADLAAGSYHTLTDPELIRAIEADQDRIMSLLKSLNGLQQLRSKLEARWGPVRQEHNATRVLDLTGHALIPPDVVSRVSPLQHGKRGEPNTTAQLMRHLFLSADSAGDWPWDPATFPRSVRGETVYSDIRVNGELTHVLSQPLMNNGTLIGVVQVARPITDLRRLLHQIHATLLILVLMALSGAGLAGAFLTERALRPVRQIARAAEELGADNLSRRLPVMGGDEFSDLASTFNRLIARLEAAFSRLEAAYEQQRRFTADASHELRTPLTTVKVNTSMTRRGEWSVDEYRQAQTAADDAADVMSRIIDDLLLLARSDGGQQPPDCCQIAMVEMLQHAKKVATTGRAGAAVTLEASDPTLCVWGDPHHLLRVFVNLLENALRHTPEHGRILLRVESQEQWVESYERSVKGHETGVVVTVADTGEGIPAEHLPHVCERFYRVDAARTRAHGGTGLGLAICLSIVEAHRGSMRIHSAVGQGTTVTVTLPGPATPA